MGMYTELHFNSELKKETPSSILAVLEYMANGEDEPAELMPKHPLFKTERWDWMLRTDSYYFDADTHSALRFDDISKTFYLCIHTNLKNYDGEIEHFIDWIMPYLNKSEGDFLGFYRYEENEEPTLIYYKKEESNE